MKDFKLASGAAGTVRAETAGAFRTATAPDPARVAASLIPTTLYPMSETCRPACDSNQPFKNCMQKGKLRLLLDKIKAGIPVSVFVGAANVSHETGLYWIEQGTKICNNSGNWKLMILF